MGQYFAIVNEDKKEYIHPHNIGHGAKLWEICVNNLGGPLLYLLRRSDETGGGDVNWPDKLEFAGRWAGDKIVVIGDYDSSNLYQHAREEFTDIGNQLAKEYNDFIEIDELKLTGRR